MEGPYTHIHRDLVDACRRGDPKAQFRIYKLYYKAMYNTSLRIVNDTAEAEDIMQESFLEAFRKINSYTGEGSFGNWIKRIVVNHSLDVLRKRKNLLPLDEEIHDIPEPSGGESEEEMVSFQVKEVREAIEMLPADYKLIITLFLIEGYDHEEISGILNISHGLSRTRYSRARQKLLSILKENRMKKAYIYN